MYPPTTKQYLQLTHLDQRQYAISEQVPITVNYRLIIRIVTKHKKGAYPVRLLLQVPKGVRVAILGKALGERVPITLVLQMIHFELGLDYIGRFGVRIDGNYNQSLERKRFYALT